MRCPPARAAVVTANRTSGAPRPRRRDPGSTASRSPCHTPGAASGYSRTVPQMSPPASPTTWIVAGSASWPSRSSPCPPPGPRNSRCSATNTWCRIRKQASRSDAVRTARQDSTGAPAAPGALTVSDEREVGPATVVTAVLEEAHRGTGLAPGAACGHPAGAEAARRQVRHHAPVDRLAVLRRRRRQVRHQAPDGRPERYHERIDAQLDGAPAALDRQAGILAHAEDHIGAHLSRAERGHRTLPGA